MNPIQVCFRINEDNLTREISGLTEAMDAFNLKNGAIITEGMEQTKRLKNKQIRFVQNKQIRFVPLWRWLLSQGAETITRG